MLKSNDNGFSSWVEEDDGSVRPRRSEEYFDWWKTRQQLQQSLEECGFKDLIDLDPYMLCMTILDQAKEIQEAEDKSKLYEQLMERINNAVQEINSLNKEVERKHGALCEMALMVKKYGQHADTCAITEALETGRLIEETACNCGWEEYRKTIDD